MPRQNSKATVQLGTSGDGPTVDRVTEILFSIVDRSYAVLQARKPARNLNSPHGGGFRGVVEKPIKKKRTHTTGSGNK